MPSVLVIPRAWLTFEIELHFDAFRRFHSEPVFSYVFFTTAIPAITGRLPFLQNRCYFVLGATPEKTPRQAGFAYAHGCGDECIRGGLNRFGNELLFRGIHESGVPL